MERLKANAKLLQKAPTVALGWAWLDGEAQ